MGSDNYQQNPQKAHPCVKIRRMTYRSSKSVHRCDLCAWRIDQKKKTKKPYSGKLGIRLDHPRRRIEIKFCMGQSSGVVLMFKFHQNRLSGFRDVWVRHLPFPVTLAVGLYNSLYCRTSRAGNCDGWIKGRCYVARVGANWHTPSSFCALASEHIGKNAHCTAF